MAFTGIIGILVGVGVLFYSFRKRYLKKHPEFKEQEESIETAGEMGKPKIR